MRTRFTKLKAFVQSLIKKHHVQYEHVVLLGFSLGGFTAEHLSQIMEKPIFALVSINSVSSPFANIQGHRSSPMNAIFLANKKDTIIPHAVSLATRSLFKKANQKTKIFERDDYETASHGVGSKSRAFLASTLENLLIHSVSRR